MRKNSTMQNVRGPFADQNSNPVRVAAPHITRTGFWLIAALTGILFGLIAQILRQIPGPLMYLGASTAPWVMVGLLLAVWASRGARTTRMAILIATGSIAAYLLAWLLSYHLLFVLRESASPSDGWRQAAPWLVASVPASLLLGIVAAMSHKRALLGEVCLAAPIAWSLAEAIDRLKAGWLDGVAILIAVAVYSTLLIVMIIKERRVQATVLIAAIVILEGLALFLFPVFWFLLSGRF